MKGLNMEITESMVYWVTRLDAVLVVCGIMVFISGAVTFISVIEQYIKTAITGMLLTIILSLGLVFIPTTRQMCAIKVLPLIAQNDNVQQLPNKIVNLADEWIGELSPKKNNTDN